MVPFVNRSRGNVAPGGSFWTQGWRRGQPLVNQQEGRPIVVGGGSIGRMRSCNSVGFTDRISILIPDTGPNGPFENCDSGFGGGVTGGVLFAPVPMANMPFTFGVHAEIIFNNNQTTMPGAPITNLGPLVGTGDIFTSESNPIFMASATAAVPIPIFNNGISIVGRIGIARTTVDTTYSCGGPPNGFCAAAPASPAFSENRETTHTGVVWGIGLTGQVPAAPFPLYWSVEYLQSNFNVQNVSFGEPATRFISNTVDPNFSMVRAGLTVPIELRY